MKSGKSKEILTKVQTGKIMTRKLLPIRNFQQKKIIKAIMRGIQSQNKNFV